MVSRAPLTTNWYKRGRNARTDGFGRDTCPVPWDGPQKTAWLAGWGHRDLELRGVGIAARAFEGQEEAPDGR